MVGVCNRSEYKWDGKIMNEQLLIRFATGADVPQVAALEQQIFSEPWTQTGLEETLSCDRHIFLVAQTAGQIVGYGLLYCNGDEGEIPTIATHPAYLHQGIGYTLLEQMLAEARRRGVVAVYLEVRRSNLAAQRLYAKCGFAIVGERRHFYRFPDEDALVMMYEKKE